MRTLGFEPDEPYPGGVDKPWLCICQRCKKPSRKTVTNVRASKGCKFCKGRVIDPVAAVEEMRAAGLEPLVPYPGSNTGWCCRCLICGFAEASPTLFHVRKGVRCRACAGQVPDLKKIAGELNAAGFVAVSAYPGVDTCWQLKCLTCQAPANLTLTSIRSGARCAVCKENQAAQQRLAWMRAANLEPQVTYPGWRFRWSSLCTSCQRPASPSLAVVRQGGGRCGYCTGLRINPDEADAVMRDAEAMPLVPFPGVNTPWRCRCLRCGRGVTPTLANVRRGQGACGYCGRRIVDPDTAAATMRGALLEPLEPYPGAAPNWRCLCLRCGKQASPSFNNVNSKGVGCKYCAASGLDYRGPACIYIAHHAGENAVKIGIAGIV